MLGIGLNRLEDATLSGGPNHTCHIKSQLFKVAYDEAVIIEWSVGEMGHLVISI